MLLSYIELVELVEAGVIDANPENINGASIDVTLGDTILVEKVQYGSPVIDLSKKQSPEMVSLIIDPAGYIMQPGQFVLASTQETFNLPNDISSEFKLKSSGARVALNNMLATWCDPCWYNSKLTLELNNCLQYNSILLKPGMKIGQMIFFRVTPVPEEHSYAVKGRYNNTTEVTESKGI